MGTSLIIENLHAGLTEGKEILKGIDLSIRTGEIHVLMGPNGGGKSTLAQVIMGHPGYKITAGKIRLGQKAITGLTPDQRARCGLFLGFQYPVEIPGVNYASFLRMAVNEKGDTKISPIAFRKELSKRANELTFAEDLAIRCLNEGFSGGEKKKSEILQMIMLQPKFTVLDEPDSGLDVDALKYISQSILEAKKWSGLLVITHYQRILKHIKPNKVHILAGGRIIKSGDASLADEVERGGYEKFQK